ncbi:MAG: GNAT family N-acetyltransferase [Pseudomonadota bacterium]
MDALDAWADASPVSAHLIAEIDAVPAGWLFFAVYEEEEKITPEETRASGSISALWVEPEFRRQGIASALIAEAEARMRDAGLKRVEIGAIVSNRRAIDLYRRLGFSDYQLSLGKQL